MTNADTEDQIIKFKAGERIITQGDEASNAYFIISGSVKVFIEEGTRKVTLATLGPDQIFGETAIITGATTYGANVEAAEDCELRVITADYLNGILDSSDPALRALILMLMQRLKDTNEALVKSETREFMDIALI